MKCPKCGCNKTVLSKKKKNINCDYGTWRTRECLKCGKEFKTLERWEFEENLFGAGIKEVRHV